MKGKLNKLFILILMVVLLAVGIAGAASVSKAAPAVNPGDTSWSALERCALSERNRARRFKWQEGKFSFCHLIKATCEGENFLCVGQQSLAKCLFQLADAQPGRG